MPENASFTHHPDVTQFSDDVNLSINVTVTVSLYGDYLPWCARIATLYNMVEAANEPNHYDCFKVSGGFCRCNAPLPKTALV